MNIDRRQDSASSVRHPVRGALLAVLLGPVFVVGAVLAITGLLSTILSGWMPSNWFSGNAADWFFGAGVRGDAANYVRFMVGGVVSAASAGAIWWGFTGGSEQH